MAIPAFDHDFVEDVVHRLGRIKPDAKPAWGELTPQGVVQHLADTMRYSMGRMGDLSDLSNWFSRTVIAPLLLRGILTIPKNIKAPSYDQTVARNDDLETMHAVLDEYLHLVQTGELEPKRHPALGEIGVDGWARLHVLHFEHHFKQFGV